MVLDRFEWSVPWSRSTSRERTISIHWIGGWVRSTAGLDAEVLQKILRPGQWSNPSHPVTHYNDWATLAHLKLCTILKLVNLPILHSCHWKSLSFIKIHHLQITVNVYSCFTNFTYPLKQATADIIICQRVPQMTQLICVSSKSTPNNSINIQRPERLHITILYTSDWASLRHALLSHDSELPKLEIMEREGEASRISHNLLITSFCKYLLQR